METHRFEDARLAVMERVQLSPGQRIAAAKARANWPQTPARILESWHGQLVSDIRPLYPRAAPFTLSQGFRAHYHEVLDLLLTVSGAAPEGYEAVSPSQPLLVTLSCISIVIVANTHQAPDVQLSPEADAESYLDTLESLSCNIRGRPTPALEELLRPAGRFWARDKHRKQFGLTKGAIGYVLMNLSFAAGGPTPELIEKVVKLEKQSDLWKQAYPAKGLIDVEGIKRIHDEMRSKYEQGFDMEAFTLRLVGQSKGSDLVNELDGRWDDICKELEPFILHPAVTTAGRLTRPPRRECFALNSEFADRIAGRDSRRKRPDRRDGLDGAQSLDELLQIRDKSAKLYEVLGSNVELSEVKLGEDLDALIDSWGLVGREREWARLIAGGNNQGETAAHMGVSRPRATELKDQVDKKARRKMSEE